MGKQVEWDYSSLASSYDKRADYSKDAIENLLKEIGYDKFELVADIGAGTGKLTKELLASGLSVLAVEPNDEMRHFGINNTDCDLVKWLEGTGENTTLEDSSVDAAFFGSSFNVLDREKALKEVERILKPGGWFICMWNHRDLDDEIQSSVENIIKANIDDYNYGARREDQTKIIKDSGLFNEVKHAAGTFKQEVVVTDYIEAWRSHATLERQAGDKFQVIIEAIEEKLKSFQSIDVPYTTKIWFAQLKTK